MGYEQKCHSNVPSKLSAAGDLGVNFRDPFLGSRIDLGVILWTRKHKLVGG